MPKGPLRTSRTGVERRVSIEDEEGPVFFNSLFFQEIIQR